MNLYIFRHGIAADTAPSDRERPLTFPGREQMRQLSDWLVKRGNVPGKIITSPLLRAAQTAEILGESAGLEQSDIVVNNVMAPGANPEKLCELLRETSYASVAIVGHAPDVQVYAAYFTGGGWLKFGRANVACIEINGPPGPESGMLRWFISPKQLGF